MQCKTCGIDKDVTEFGSQQSINSFRTRGTYTRLHCKACLAVKAKAFRQRNPGYRGTGRQSQYAGMDKLVASACSLRVLDAKTRAKKAGTPFDLDTAYMFRLLNEQGHVCALSGLPLSFETGSPHVLSIDQIVAGQGYTKGNVQWVSWAVNRAKGDLSLGAFHTMCRAILGRCNDYPGREYSQVAGSA